MENSNKYRVTQITESGERNVSQMGELELQKLRAKRLQNFHLWSQNSSKKNIQAQQ